jgi:hypothetical protein
VVVGAASVRTSQSAPRYWRRIHEHGGEIGKEIAALVE